MRAQRVFCSRTTHSAKVFCFGTEQWNLEQAHNACFGSLCSLRHVTTCYHYQGTYENHIFILTWASEGARISACAACFLLKCSVFGTEQWNLEQAHNACFGSLCSLSPQRCYHDQGTYANYILYSNMGFRRCSHQCVRSVCSVLEQHVLLKCSVLEQNSGMWSKLITHVSGVCVRSEMLPLSRNI